MTAATIDGIRRSESFGLENKRIAERWAGTRIDSA